MLMYAIPALLLTTGQVNELNARWNNVKCTLFGYNRWQSISALLLSLENISLCVVLLISCSVHCFTAMILSITCSALSYKHCDDEQVFFTLMVLTAQANSVLQSVNKLPTNCGNTGC